ncbi:MAG TPA: TonB family protein [Methylomirabilota bacterium]|nr:TonB family protein [Methylomirabilota bacterium]
MLQDRRRHTRQLITPHLYVALNSSTSGGVLTDVSEGGMALNLVGPPVSDDVLLDLNLSGSDEHFQTKGQVTWTKESEGRVGLKFMDLTESSRLQIKKWLANTPVATELKQNLQTERNDPGTNVRDTEAPEAEGSRAIALNHEELETAAQPTELRSIEVTGTTKQVDRQDSKTEAVRNANPSVGLQTASQEPLTNAAETQTLEAPRSPAVTLDHDAELLREMKESLAKKSDTAESQDALVSAGANDAAQVKIKTLEAPFTEAQGGQADIPNPTLRRERKEPVTQAQETLLAEATRRASVGTLPSDRLFQKKSLAKSSVPVDLEPNVPIQDCAKSGSSVQYGERQLEKIAEPSALGTIGVTKTTSNEKDAKEPNTALFAASSPGLRTEKKAPTPIEQAMQAPKFPVSLTAASEQDDNLAQTLRTSFARSESRQVRAPLLERWTEDVAVDRGVLRRWILASVAIFWLIVLLAVARWVYTSPIFDKIASVSDIREMITRVFSSANGSQTGAVAHHVDSKGADRQLRQEKGKLENDEMRPDGPSVRRPRVRFDAQKQRKGLAQVNTAVKAPSVAGETNQVPEAQSTGLQTQQQVGTQVGHVSLHAAANLPEQIILPAYPAVAWQKSVQGRVTLKALISKDGTLRNIRLVGPRPPSLLSGSVLEAVKKWRYQPRIENGMAVEVETQITIDFER